MRIAGGFEEWQGLKVRNGPVVYLAGEGHHGLRARVAAWCHHYEADDIELWISKEGCNLNTEEGYAKVIAAIAALGINPWLIVVDTLHRFLLGDENKSVDAKTMLDACARLIAEYDCSVALVHHTGLSEDAQTRARGSSAWRGALDIEVSVVPSTDDKPIEIIQRKSKDAELAQPLNVMLKKVVIPNWYDEDGEPVNSAVIVSADNEYVTTKHNPVPHAIKTAIDSLLNVARDDRGDLEEWRAAFYAARNGKQDTKLKAFQRAMKTMEKERAIKIHGDTVVIQYDCTAWDDWQALLSIHAMTGKR